MPPLSDPELLTCYKNALANWRFGDRSGMFTRFTSIFAFRSMGGLFTSRRACFMMILAMRMIL